MEKKQGKWWEIRTKRTEKNEESDGKKQGKWWKRTRKRTEKNKEKNGKNEENKKTGKEVTILSLRH